jgi:hypothetical protein
MVTDGKRSIATGGDGVYGCSTVRREAGIRVPDEKEVFVIDDARRISGGRMNDLEDCDACSPRSFPQAPLADPQFRPNPSSSIICSHSSMELLIAEPH